jgi:imidazolonepropionase-like amidohydrolase
VVELPVRSGPVASFAFLVALITTPASGQEPTLIVENGRVIVGEGTVLERGSVIVAGDRIVDVTEEVVTAGDARRIDASGKTVLPGLIVANVHLVMTIPGPEGQPRSEEELAARIQSELPERLRAYLGSGVTSVMSTSDYWPFILDVREDLATGRWVGPRLVTVGPAIGAPGGHPEAFVCGDNGFCKAHLSAAVDDPADARRTVARLAESGVDAIKLVWDDMGGRMPALSPELVQTVIDEAHARELPVHIHVVDAGLAAQALEWGADRLDHVPAPASEEAADAFVEAMRAHRASAATTLLTLDWLVHQRGSPPEMLRVQEAVRQMTKRLAASGDLLVALGTDAPWLTPSESIQSEVRLLEEAGLSPMQILRAATLGAAAHIGRGEDLGTLEPGMIADLIVVDGNPLEDLSMLWRTEFVVKEGEVVISN